MLLNLICTYVILTYLLTPTYHPNGKTPFAFPAEEEAV